MVQINDHYFSAEPGTPATLVRHTLHWRGLDFVIDSAGGVFSRAGLDKGTQVLLDKAPNPPASGLLVDVGCGWGPLTLTLARLSPQARVWGVDTNQRARELTLANARAARLGNVKVSTPQSALQELGPQSIDLIWSNPPIRIGKTALHELMAAWLECLKPDGQAWWVISKNLGADSLQSWLIHQGWPTTKMASSKGFRLLQTVAKN